MKRGFQEEHVEYVVSMPTSHLTQQSAFTGTSPKSLKHVSIIGFFYKITSQKIKSSSIIVLTSTCCI